MPTVAELQVVLTAKDQMSGTFKGAREEVEKIGTSAKGLPNIFGGITNSLGKLGLAGIGLSTVGEAAKGLAGALGIGLASEAERVRSQFLAFTKSAEQTDAILAQVRAEADKTPFSFRAMADATASLLPASKQAGVGMMDLIHQSEILAAINPAEGLSGAAFSLKEALSGDFTSIVERFNLPRDLINKLKAEGVPALEIVSRALASMGADMDLVSNMAGTTEGRLSTFQDAIDGLRVAVGKPILQALGTQLDRLSGFLNDNRERITALAQTVGTMFSNAVEGASRRIMALAGVVKDLYERFQPVIETIREQLQPVIEFLGRHIDDFLIPAFVALAAIVGIAAAEMVIALAPIVVPIVAIGAAVALLREAWEQDWGGIQEKTAAVWAVLEPIFGAIAGWFSEVSAVILPEAAAAWENVTAVIGQAWSALWEGYLKPALAEMAAWWAAHWDTISAVAGAVWSTITLGIRVAWDVVQGIILAGLQVLQGDWAGAWDSLAGAVQAAWNDIRGTLGALAGILGSVAQMALGAAREIGANIIQGIIGGIQGGIRSVQNAAAGMAQSALASAKAALGVGSPSKAFQQVGRFVGEGLVLGLSDGKNAVAAAASDLATASLSGTDAIKSGWAEAADAVRNATGDMASAMSSLATTASASASQSASAASATMSGWQQAAALARQIGAVAPGVMTAPSGGGGGGGGGTTAPPASTFGTKVESSGETWYGEFQPGGIFVPYEKRQRGGPVWPGTPFLVGEQGPELFVPNSGGSIVPGGGGMGGPTTIVLEIDGRRFAQAAVPYITDEQDRSVRIRMR